MGSMLSFITDAARGMGYSGMHSADSMATRMMMEARHGIPRGTGFGGGAFMGMMAGGFAANFNSSPENRGIGAFMKGGLLGGLGGAGLSVGLSKGLLSRGTGAAFSAAVERGNLRASQYSHGAWKASRLVESASARKYAFASGAMLTGGMMGGDRSHARGFNSSRGNRFSG